MSLVRDQESFTHILRILNTNVEGTQRVMYGLTAIRGVGRRFSTLVCQKADVDITKRAGELTPEEVERLVTIIQNPLQFKIPEYFLNRQKDFTTGKYTQLTSSGLDIKLRDDLERLKKIKSHRGIRHYLQIRVRGQHTKTTGRRGKRLG
eukprot:CAMPEP_0173271264 /NCGR_PEP_ID=MMETSP1143-20121109/716_1 /TAXON_ID=483371 /ORGANISM="non described non described, Strain CCMP2298" /LENGTH=148 /DNA_ID=CAMNT_0014207801 /DNA_START=14 /DNA_END=460 /DNA_ORIENTATION=+